MITQPELSLVRALRGEALARPPLWLMRQAGRYLPEYREVRRNAGDFLALCYSPETCVELALQPIRRFGFDAAIIFSDILVIADALGLKVEFQDGVGPVLEAIADERDIPRFEAPRLENHLAPVYRAVAGLKANRPPEVAVIGFAGAPWTLAAYMVEGRGGGEFTRARRWAWRDPQSFARLIEVLVEAISHHLVKQADSGAHAVQIFDSWAGLLGESQFQRWVIAPTQDIVRRFKAAHPAVPVIGFPRGAGALYRDYAAQTGVDAVGLDSTVPLAWARDSLQARVAVQGNFDNQALVAGGAALGTEASRILEAFGRGPFVFNLGHGVLPETPPEHVAELVRLVRAWKG